MKKTQTLQRRFISFWQPFRISGTSAASELSGIDPKNRPTASTSSRIQMMQACGSGSYGLGEYAPQCGSQRSAYGVTPRAYQYFLCVLTDRDLMLAEVYR